MEKLIISLFVLAFSFKAFSAEVGEDPYKKIEHLILKNGMQVFLAPSQEATTTELRLEVGVGWEVEKKGEYGISHLLEHVLFRDKQLQDEMTYLQLIKEAGGSANGSTSPRQTSYFGSIPAKKGTWLLESFGKMILEPSIIPEYVQKEKGTVELEIGRPGPVSETLGFNPMDYIYPDYVKEPSFWKSEFGITNQDEKFTRTEEQLSNRQLQVPQLVEHYKNWYYPSNMKLFVAGKYDREQILAEINSRWAPLPAREGKKLAALPKPNPVDRPYIRRTFWQETPYVYLGAKAWNMTYKDVVVASSYMDFLSHRLMKEIRNVKGQTYSASSWDYFANGYGYGAIQFQTPKEHLKENIDIAKAYIQTEARDGQFTEKQMKEAVTQFLAQYELMGRDAEKMMSLAQNYDNQLTEYGKFISPFEILQKASLEEYNASLKATFNEKHAYDVVYTPPLFFAADVYIMYFLVALGSFIGLRRLFTKPFAHDRVQWVRKVKYPPVKVLEALGLIVVYYGVLHTSYVINTIFWGSNFIQSHLILSQYLHSALSVFSMILIAQGVYSLMPRKLMVVDGKLMIKSVTYYSKVIALNEIANVEAIRGFTKMFNFNLWFRKVSFRYFNVNPKFWQKSLLINLKNGKSYYFSVNDADKVCAELKAVISRNEKVPEIVTEKAA